MSPFKLLAFGFVSIRNSNDTEICAIAIQEAAFC
jgi:hypothetical protein